MMTNCPNCGAPIVSTKCEYCETIFPEWMILPDPYARAAKLLETSNIMEFMTPNEVRELVGLNPIKDRRDYIEERRHKLEIELIDAKLRALKHTQKIETMYEEALEAMQRYTRKD